MCGSSDKLERNWMQTNFIERSSLTRRDFFSGAAALGAGAMIPSIGSEALAQQRARPNSTINGVRLGINAPFSFRGQFQSAQETLDAMTRLGLSWVELRGPSIEGYAGLPPAQPAAGGGGGGGGQQPATPEQQAARAAAAQRRADEIKRWRLSQSMDKYRELRHLYESSGVYIQLVKFPDLTANLDDDEAAYIFEVAKTLGAEAITTEPPVSHTKRLGKLATQHRVMIGYHGHAGGDRERFGQDGAWEQAFFYSPFNGANLDIGHYMAGNNVTPIPFIREYSHRITNLHIKDRKKDLGPDVPWGEGDSQVATILRMMRDEKYTFQATMEVEHPIPAGSDVLTEIANCISFARNALNS